VKVVTDNTIQYDTAQLTSRTEHIVLNRPEQITKEMVFDGEPSIGMPVPECAFSEKVV